MKLLLVISEDWYFCSHRMPIAADAVKQGWYVHLACQVAGCRDEIEAAGIVLHHAPLRRGSINPLFDLGYLWRLVRLYRREKPDVVHHVAMKPCLYGSLAAWLCRVPRVVNALAGMGFLLSSSSLAVRLIRWPVLCLFRLLFNRRNSTLILQNPDDIAMFTNQVGVKTDHIRLIRGSGVDLAEFSPGTKAGKADIPIFVMVSRLLGDKGVIEFIEAAGILKNRCCDCRLVLVGDADKLNPNAVDEATIKAAMQKDWIDWLGRRRDVADIYRAADVAVLPSYREGMPKSLIEAAACGLAILTTDMPGCREMVRRDSRETECRRLRTEGNEGETVDHRLRTADQTQESGIAATLRAAPRPSLTIGINGILVPPRDAQALADSIEWLVEHPEERTRMGQISRDLAEREFGIEAVVNQTLAIYTDTAQ